MTTLSDVARHAGVSATTVSHVLNGTRFVSPETRNAVDEAVRATGYRPNALARALRTSTTLSIGFVASDVSNPYSTAVMKGLETAARRAGYMLLVANSDEDPVAEAQAITALEQRRVDGMIIALTSASGEAAIDQLENLSVPVVLVDRAVPGAFDQVLVDNTASVKTLVGHLLDLGHRRVAMLAGRSRGTNSAERVIGWTLAHEERGLAADPGLLAYGGTHPDTAMVAARRLLSTPDRPTALFAGSNQLTLGALRALRDLGMSIPGDVALAAFDESDYADILEPPLTRLVQPTFEIGEEAVRLLLRRISSPSTEPTVERLRPTLKYRGSCGDDAGPVLV